MEALREMSDQTDDQQLRDKLERIDAKAKSLKADVTLVNEKIGYVAESVETVQKGYEEILNRCSTQDDVRPTIASGDSMASAIEQPLNDMRKPVDRLSYRVDFALPIFAATSGATVTSITSFAPETQVVRFRPYPFAQNSDMES